ncbi:zinc dependent phospholipase C family protein [Neobacillus mesonae]|uniref:Phospholipase C/D domain-containing protein n=1 Tax=Neobacillus mesonae TaxID=1193713 RepID=A0A3Q9QSY6_9BACI|nr:zinc dependent phospholipase C family protein [Neobacillus mesonae]AZU62559.1 hypothetical protein CHR53_15480 [Neobacillus mesonae]
MSGPAVHHIVASEFLRKSLKLRYTDPKSTAFWDEMDEYLPGKKYTSYFHFGAVGPDFLFFNMNDWPAGGAIKPIAQVYWEIKDFMEDFKEMLLDLVPQPVMDAIDELEKVKNDVVKRSVVLSEIESLLNDTKNNIEGIKLLVDAKIKEYVTDGFDLFNMLKHPYQDGQDFAEWWWFDTLHYRRTGKFMAELMRNSKDYSPERAYALGYLTHFATDVVGHPYVNAISGGPYRTHAQRHKTAENYQDVWAYQQYRQGEFVNSGLWKKYVIESNPRALPKDLNQFILKCIHNVYYDNGKPLYGRDISEKDLDLSYRNWLEWFESSTVDDVPRPVPYSINQEIAQAWTTFTNNVGDISKFVGSSSSGKGGILGLFKTIAAIIIGPILLAAALVDFLIGSLTTIGTAPLRFFLSLTYENIYNSYMNFRQGLSMNGFAFPHRSQITHRFTEHLNNTSIPDPFNHTAATLQKAYLFPTKKFQRPGLLSESHLVYPFPEAKNLEIDSTSGYPSNYNVADPSFYMTNPSLVFDQKMYDYYRKFTEADPSMGSLGAIYETYQEISKYSLRGGLGNAVAFSSALYDEYMKYGQKVEYVDFNLDGDRTYGMKCWRKVKDLSLVNKPINDYHITNVPVGNEVLHTQTDVIDPDGSLL